MIKNLLNADESDSETQRDFPARSSDSVLSLFDTPETGDGTKVNDHWIVSDAEPQSMAETVRQSGLAWSAGIAFFAAVVFMLVLGWGADVLLGNSPWGIVGG